MLQPATQIDIPEHVAIIMDGNRRWAQSRKLPIVEGYRKGVVALREAVRGALDCGVSRLTVYGFSTENWSRSKSEVGLIMQLCATVAHTEKASLLERDVRVEVIGDLDAFAFPARVAVSDLVRSTARNHRLTLTLALNYGGREEIVRAARAIASDVAAGKLDPGRVDEAALRERLYAPHAPDPDLLIRTGGDQRVSNFLLYQMAYTELLTLPLMWPDFSADDFANAVLVYSGRSRRFGS
jgi:undecaprenyl diphosphate synthase